MLTKFYKWIAGIALAISLGFGIYFYGVHDGKAQQIATQAVQIEKANVKMGEKNQESQTIANKTEEAQIVYKDRIVTKFQTVEKEVVKYVETQAATVGLDPDFVRLHNAAASANGEVPIAGRSSDADGQAIPTGVTTGEAIGVITRNYEQHQLCRAQVIGWQTYYTDLQKSVNN